MFCIKIETLSTNVITTLLRGAPFTSHAVTEFEVLSFFGHNVVFCQCGFESLEVLENFHARRWGSLTREITLNDEFLRQSLPDRKALLMTLKQLFKVFAKLSVSRGTMITSM